MGKLNFGGLWEEAVNHFGHDPSPELGRLIDAAAHKWRFRRGAKAGMLMPAPTRKPATPGDRHSDAAETELPS